VLSIPIVVASTWMVVSVIWTRTHQDVEPPPAGDTYPVSAWHERSFDFPAVGGSAPQSRTVEVADHTIVQGGRTRTAIMSRPTTVDPAARLPVIVYLHGLGGTSIDMFREGGNGTVPAVFPSIAVFPEGEWFSWNAGGCCRPATVLGTDDVAYLQALVTDMKQRPEVDPTRVFMFGVSNGGMMMYRYLCDHADELAGAMSVAGTNVSGCQPNAPIPILQEHGTSDQIVSYEGTTTLVTRLFGSTTLPSAPDAIAGVAGSMKCGPSVPGPSSQAFGFTVTSVEWSGCAGGAKVRFVTYHGMTHWWPVGPPWSTMLDAPQFFGLLPASS
jgi:polyhydroxybutyrate depolymerase